jgi:hypothetical protein
MNPGRSLFAALLFGCAFFTGCATIVKDDSQPVAFSSDPQGATVSINNVARGTTPTTVMVKRARQKQMVQYDLLGYETVVFPLGKSVAGMTFGNIIFGGVIGVGVDIATGKATNYEDSVHVKMIPVHLPDGLKAASVDVAVQPMALLTETSAGAAVVANNIDSRKD